MRAGTIRRRNLGERNMSMVGLPEACSHDDDYESTMVNDIPVLRWFYRIKNSRTTNSLTLSKP
jgi:hypothetical protein